MTRILSCWLLALCLAAVPAAASTGIESDKVDDSVMIWVVSNAANAGEGATVTFEILKDGEPLARESLLVDLPAPDARDAVAVELLADRSELRDTLAALLRRDRVELTVRVSIDGIPTEEAPLARIIETTRARLGQVELLPFAHAPAVEAAPRGSSPRRTLAAVPGDLDLGISCSDRDACRADCEAQYLTCMEGCSPGDPEYPLPDRYPGDPVCDACAEVRDSCLASCPGCVCVEPRSSDTYTVTEIVSGSYAGTFCYGDPYQYGSKYEKYNVQYRHTQYHKVTSCDGTVSVSSLGSYYTYDSCYSPYIPSQCSPAQFGIPLPLC